MRRSEPARCQLDRRACQRGLTLLELLAVVAILAIISGGVVILFGNTEDDAAEQIAMSEMREIKEALLRFKQDTGFLPKQGPFDLATQPGGAVPLGNLPAYVPVGGELAWFDSPANFWELYENPLAGTGHPLEPWNPNTRRGWRGPYLSRFGEGLVDLGDNLNPDGSGSPTAGSVLSRVRAVADPFVDQPANGVYLVWRTNPGDSPHPRWGRPYLLFDLDDVINPARLVSMGQNRQYDGGTADDIVLDLLR